jgi:hypothetical protein
MSYKFEKPALTSDMHKRHACIDIQFIQDLVRSVTTNNNQVFCISMQIQVAATSRPNRRFCLCLRLDSDNREFTMYDAVSSTTSSQIMLEISHMNLTILL